MEEQLKTQHPSLDLVPTKELLEELKRRYDSLVFAAERTRVEARDGQPRQIDVAFDHHGNGIAFAGLVSFLEAHRDHWMHAVASEEPKDEP